MKKSFFKSALIGILLGLLTFFAFRLVIILLIIGAIFKLSGKGKHKRQQWRGHKLAYADKIRNMNDDDFQEYKTNFGKGRGCH